MGNMSRSKAAKFHEEIKVLISQGKTNPEIADELNLSKATIGIYAFRVLGGNQNYLKKNTKHTHLHKQILEMRLELNDAEIRKKLNLTSGEMKSCMTCAYRKPELAHLRKEKRIRGLWSDEELRYLLMFAGLKSRDDINAHLKRGKSGRVIKEYLQKLGLCSKNVNGLTHSQFIKLFKRAPLSTIKTSAGSTGGWKNRSGFKIVAWVHIEEMIRDKYIIQSEAICIYIEAMARFQRWVHGENLNENIVSKLQCAVNDKKQKRG